MLRITIELFPFGNKEETKKISVVDIYNTGETAAYENSIYTFHGWWQDVHEEIHYVDGENIVSDRKKIVWVLIDKVIKNILSKRGY